MAQKLKLFVIPISFLVLCLSPLATPKAQAASCTNPKQDSSCQCSSQGCDNGRVAVDPTKCASLKPDSTDASKCEPLGNGCPTGTSQHDCLAKNQIVIDLNLFVDFLSAAVGIVVVTMVIIGGIQYSMAGNNPTALTAAKQRITNAIIAIVAFILIFTFLQWLIPGGVFS